MNLINKAKKMRRNSTEAERKIWMVLRNRQISGEKFRRQVPVGKYIADFLCFEKKLIIEIDGGQHMEQRDYDNQRTKWFEQQGFKVMRFWNNQVLQEFDAVKNSIYHFLKNTPSP